MDNLGICSIPQSVVYIGPVTIEFSFLRLLNNALLVLGLRTEVVRAIRVKFDYPLDFATMLFGEVFWMEIILERITRSDFPPILSLLQRSSIKESTDSRDQI